MVSWMDTALHIQNGQKKAKKTRPKEGQNGSRLLHRECHIPWNHLETHQLPKRMAQTD